MTELEPRMMLSAPMANGDYDHSGTVDLNDYAFFRAEFNCGTPSAIGDFDDSGSVDLVDFAEFRNRMNLPASQQPPVGISNVGGIVTLRANTHRVTCTIRLSQFDPSQVNFQLSGNDAAGNLVINQSLQVPLSSLNRIYFYGFECGLTSFLNDTPVPCTAFGGSSGGSSLYGGSAGDKLYAGAGDTVIRGNAGNDLLIGGPGQDYLYGGEGQDDIRPGAGDFVIQD